MLTPSISICTPYFPFISTLCPTISRYFPSFPGTFYMIWFLHVSPTFSPWFPQKIIKTNPIFPMFPRVFPTFFPRFPRGTSMARSRPVMTPCRRPWRPRARVTWAERAQKPWEEMVVPPIEPGNSWDFLDFLSDFLYGLLILAWNFEPGDLIHWFSGEYFHGVFSWDCMVIFHGIFWLDIVFTSLLVDHKKWGFLKMRDPQSSP